MNTNAATNAATETAAPSSTINGIDVGALKDVMRAITDEPAKGIVEFRVRSDWQGQTRSESTVESYTIGGKEVPRTFRVAADEPIELLGSNTAPNPQELLMAALNACIMVGYVVGASVEGITLAGVEIETTGALDLRGFLGIDAAVPPGYEVLRYRVKLSGDGTPEQYRRIHQTVLRTSPNYFNLSRPVRIDAELEIG